MPSLYTAAEFQALVDRLEADEPEKMGPAIHDCFVTGVAFSLRAEDWNKALEVLKCADSAALSERIKAQLIERLKKT